MTIKSELEIEKKKVAETIDNSIHWPFPEKNIERLYSSVAMDSRFFIFHPDSKSTIVGYDAFQKMIDEVFLNDACRPISTVMTDMRINVSASKEVAWFSCLLDDQGEWQGKKYHWKNCRWTGVLEKREGDWKIVQMHFSFASDAKTDPATYNFHTYACAVNGMINLLDSSGKLPQR